MAETVKVTTLESYKSVIDDLEARNRCYLEEIESLGKRTQEVKERVRENQSIIASLRKKLDEGEEANPGILELAKLTRPQIAERVLEKVGHPLGLTELATKLRDAGVDMDNKHAVVSLHTALTKSPGFIKVRLAGGKGKSVWTLAKWQGKENGLAGPKRRAQALPAKARGR